MFDVSLLTFSELLLSSAWLLLSEELSGGFAELSGEAFVELSGELSGELFNESLEEADELFAGK